VDRKHEARHRSPSVPGSLDLLIGAGALLVDGDPGARLCLEKSVSLKGELGVLGLMAARGVASGIAR
jgi:hypothetical protein